MKNLIQDELELAKSKMIDDFSFMGNKLVRLTQENVAIVEAMIRNDSAYIRSSDVDAEPQNKYGGSTAYWMTLLKKYLFEGEQGTKLSYESIIKGAVEAVDRENSTHLNADKCGRSEIIDRISKFDKKEFVECLRNPEYKDMKLFTIISDKTKAQERARTNPSFASKFCHYACFYIFEGTEYQDNYSIYDGILKTVLPWYLDYYKIKQVFNLKDYKQYRNAVDFIREEAEEKLSRNGFDHLLWYYHKGRV